jgi:hypothetical protein
VDAQSGGAAEAAPLGHVVDGKAGDLEQHFLSSRREPGV